MRDVIYKEYAYLTKNLYNNYDRVKIIDNYDFYTSCPYTIFYLNKNESFDKFSDLWNKVIEESRELDLDYDDILWQFETQAKEYKFDYVELGTLDIFTDKDYTLEI